MTDAHGNSRIDERPGRAADDDVLARIELGLAQLLRRAERTSAATTARGRSDDLDRSGYLLLHTLDARGGQHVRVLAGRLGLDASTVTRQVVSLERAGHVRRSRDPHDGRAVVVAATDEGRRALAAQRQARNTTYATVLSDWSDADRAQLATLVDRLNTDLDEYRLSAS